MRGFWWLALALIVPTIVYAQFYYDGPPRRCVPRAALIDELVKIGEVPRGIGLRLPTGITELWVNDDPSAPTWSILILRKTGEACLVGHGTQWLIPPHAHKDGQPEYKPEGEALCMRTI